MTRAELDAIAKDVRYGDGYVYLITNGRHTKIGWTLAPDPKARAARMQTDNPRRLRVVGFVPGGKRLEAALQEYFIKQRRDLDGGTEWFWHVPQMEHIAESLRLLQRFPRVCAHCELPMPETARSDARFCSPACQKASRRAKERDSSDIEAGTSTSSPERAATVPRKPARRAASKTQMSALSPRPRETVRYDPWVERVCACGAHLRLRQRQLTRPSGYRHRCGATLREP